MSEMLQHYDLKVSIVWETIEFKRNRYIHDRVAGGPVFEEAIHKYPSLKGVCADAGYCKTMEQFVEKVLKKTIEISQRIRPGWAVLPKRWAVERTFAWLNHFRRLSKDYKITVKSAGNIIIIAHSMILLRRLA